MKPTPEQLNRVTEAVENFDAPWITDVNKLNRVFQAAHHMFYKGMFDPSHTDIELLWEAIEAAMAEDNPKNRTVLGDEWEGKV